MERVVFLSTDNLEGYVFDDELAARVLEAQGVSVSTIPWRAEVDWSDFDLVVLRTTWDYQLHLGEFLEKLAVIDGLTRLANPITVLRRFTDKRYLLDLERKGVPIVPTRILEQAVGAEEYLAMHDAEEIVIKPTIGATALDTFRIRDVVDDEVLALFEDRPHLVQPFQPAILDEGEVSIFFFSGALSHAISKTPKSGDFRSQEEHGGDIQPIEPEPTAIEAAQKAIATIDEPLLYGRVDLVRSPQNEWLVMELEVVEPALYFRMDPESPARFATALLAW